MGKRIRKVVIILIVMALCMGSTVYAKGDDDSKFGITVSVSGPDRDGNYNLRVKVTNNSGDFTGSVRLIVNDDAFGRNCYETEISVAGGDSKEYTVKIPSYAVYDTNDIIYAYIVDGKGNTRYSDKFPKLFQSSNYSMNVGILSDTPDSLTYFDCSGRRVWIVTEEYSVILKNLDKDTLMDNLQSVKYLVIDNYDLSNLNAEDIEAIENWVIKSGGNLILGTGANGLEALDGFSDGFVDIEKKEQIGVGTPGDSNNGLVLTDSNIDALSIAVKTISLKMNSVYMRDYETGVYIRRRDEGSITVAPYMFSDAAIGNSDTEGFANILLQNAMANSNVVASQDMNTTYWYDYNELYTMIQGNIDFNIGGIKFIIIVFVLLIGPILYLILKLANKREWYYAIVPIMSLAVLLIIYMLGSGMQIRKIQANTVTIDYANEGYRTTSLFIGYSPRGSEWKVKVNDKYDTISGAYRDYYYGGNQNMNAENYTRKILKSGEGNYIGYKPSSSFDETVFKLSAEGNQVGEITLSGVDFTNDYKGVVINNTGYDLKYVFVEDSGRYFIIEDFAKGKTIDISTYAVNHSYFMGDIDSIDVRYSLANNVRYDENLEKASYMAALTLGLTESYKYSSTESYVIGVTDNYNKVTDDKNCDEKSFGCIVNIVRR